MATLIGVLVLVGIAVVWLVSVLSMRKMERPRGRSGFRGSWTSDGGASSWFGGSGDGCGDGRGGFFGGGGDGGGGGGGGDGGGGC